MSSNAPTRQLTMVMIRFLRLLECCGGGAAAVEEAAGADEVGVADAATGEDGDEDEDEEDGNGVAVCCDTAEEMTPTTEATFPRN